MGKESKSKFGFTGIALGSIALLMALIHFYAGPFAPQPSLEETVANKAVAIKEATIAKLKGEEIKKAPVVASLDTDKILNIAIAALGGLAFILGILGYALKEPLRVAGGAAILGGSAIAFQFLTLALGAIIIVILVAAVLTSGIG